MLSVWGGSGVGGRGASPFYSSHLHRPSRVGLLGCRLSLLVFGCARAGAVGGWCWVLVEVDSEDGAINLKPKPLHYFELKMTI